MNETASIQQENDEEPNNGIQGILYKVTFCFDILDKWSRIEAMLKLVSIFMKTLDLRLLF